MEPEPLTDVMADPGFYLLVEKGGIGQNVLFTQIALEEKHLLEMTEVGIIWSTMTESHNDWYLISGCHLCNDGCGMCRSAKEWCCDRSLALEVLIKQNADGMVLL